MGAMSATVGVQEPKIIEFLRNPNSYGEHPKEVQLIETHVSWVFLTERFAYKLKKPVRFSFLDFSTAQKRRDACEDELRLNRRLAPDVYLAVVPIWQTAQGKFRWQGEDEPIDWVVKMRRLPEEVNLQHRLVNNALTERELETLAEHLAAFYQQQPPLTLRPEEMRKRLVEQIRDNLSDLCQSLPDQINRLNLLHAAQLRYVTTHRELLDGRVCDGRYVEAHGDLRPEHIYLLSRPRIIDGLEFSRSLREMDIADELSFLTMECERLGHPAVGQRIVDRYTEETGDRPPRSLLAFYRTYRACVRAKVHALHAAQLRSDDRRAELNQASQYLNLAERNQGEMGRGLVVAVCGLMGSGKSTLAAALADTLGGTLLQTDQIRRDRFGKGTGGEAFGEGVYQAEKRNVVYAQLLTQCSQLVESGATVIVDGTFAEVKHRRRLKELAAAHQAGCLFVRCECPREICLQRIEQRRNNGHSVSEAREELYDQQAAAWAPLQSDETFIHVDSRQSVAIQLDEVLKALAIHQYA
jgi:aminoglycoside phosphotransferase family enzyme/predicted kinase